MKRRIVSIILVLSFCIVSLSSSFFETHAINQKDNKTSSGSLNYIQKAIKKDGSGDSYETEYNFNIRLDKNKFCESKDSGVLNNVKYKVCSIEDYESGSIEKTKRDRSISIAVTLKVYYKISDGLLSMTKINSKLKAYNGSKKSHVGSGVFIDSNKLTYGQYDIGHSGQKQTKRLPAKACNKTIKIPKKWKPVESCACIVGADQSVELHRGKSKWRLIITNNVIDNMPGWS